eukprot:TRINITY_DN2924_c0_g1_i8.p1 TRINITY_DN2924_c0_g1~~TRINITY_DN2924_c0_g1_i8.p1  ORF type:complete len:502 (+),score=84.83 TRINITY_DN2924_c0_g1_i8:216-1721(+)
MRMIVQVFLLLHVYTATSSPQLIGSRGVIKLREGVEYRDPETVEASETVANFAREFQEVDDDIAERHSHANSFRSRQNEVSPRFRTQLPDNVKGRPLIENEIFDFLESRFLEPPQELQFNKFLDEVEIERATSPIRLLPGEGLPPTPRPATRAPNRLVNLQRPVEESVRSQNAQFSTVFGPPTNNNFQTDRRPSINPLQNNFLESNQLQNNIPSGGFNSGPPPQNAPLFPLEQPRDANGQHVIRPFVNLNEGTKFLTGQEPAPHQRPQPEFIGHLNGGVGPSSPNIGFSSSPQNVGPSGPPLNQGLGATFHPEASFSGDSFHQEIGPIGVGLSSGPPSGLSSLPPSHLSGANSFSGSINTDLSSGPLQGLSRLPPSPTPHVSSLGLHASPSLSSPPYQQYFDPQLSHNLGLSNSPVQHGFGLGPEIYPGPRLSSGSSHPGLGLSVPVHVEDAGYRPFRQNVISGLQGVPSGQAHGFSGLGGPRHSFSEGPHHSLTIQHHLN